MSRTSRPMELNMYQCGARRPTHPVGRMIDTPSVTPSTTSELRRNGTGSSGSTVCGVVPTGWPRSGWGCVEHIRQRY